MKLPRIYHVLFVCMLNLQCLIIKSINLTWSGRSFRRPLARIRRAASRPWWRIPASADPSGSRPTWPGTDPRGGRRRIRRSLKNKLIRFFVKTFIFLLIERSNLKVLIITVTVKFSLYFQWLNKAKSFNTFKDHYHDHNSQGLSKGTSNSLEFTDE